MRKPECPSHSTASASIGQSKHCAVTVRAAPAGDRSSRRRRAMSEKTVLWDVDGGVGRITLNRPQTLNAWIAEFGAELRDIITGPAAEADVRAVLITGA